MNVLYYRAPRVLLPLVPWRSRPGPTRPGRGCLKRPSQTFEAMNKVPPMEHMSGGGLGCLNGTGQGPVRSPVPTIRGVNKVTLRVIFGIIIFGVKRPRGIELKELPKQFAQRRYVLAVHVMDFFVEPLTIERTRI